MGFPAKEGLRAEYSVSLCLWSMASVRTACWDTTLWGDCRTDRHTGIPSFSYLYTTFFSLTLFSMSINLLHTVEPAVYPSRVGGGCETNDAGGSTTGVGGSAQSATETHPLPPPEDSCYSHTDSLAARLFIFAVIYIAKRLTSCIATCRVLLSMMSILWGR